VGEANPSLLSLIDSPACEKDIVGSRIFSRNL